ncbi:MAG TPA: vitamin B12 dependent-methionine synthase activation domain-containing protein, partial [Gemmatimonadales bacterium]|nr:vitamin B12 dependent-methionine synthase activation domain-containing protein [Gemmatimonadales bacterium]
ASSLLNPAQRERFAADVRADYDALRREREGVQRVAPRLPIAAARENRLKIDWSSSIPPVPQVRGVQELHQYPLRELVERIDWTPFFQTWELSGHYPAILEDAEVGPAARALFQDAHRLLERIVCNNLLEARAVFGFWPANSVGDDIELYLDDDRTQPLATWRTLRQQGPKTGDRPNLALADYVAPSDSGRADFVGAFAVTAGIGLDRLIAQFRADHDDYSAILAESLADRLAEAFAERLHERVRREFWGYAPNEALDNNDLIHEAYQGIRPAPGYPACPDHTEKQTIFALLDAEARIGIHLTESCAMLPGSSVSGYYFWRPEARYFGVGKIERDQVEDYARRKGISVAEAERWLSPNLAYARS